MRIRAILEALPHLSLPQNPIYADLGSGNGWMTDQVARKIGATVADAYDVTPRQLEDGRARYPRLRFHPVDLNRPLSGDVSERYDFVTCFETVEHVGRPDVAIRNVIRAKKGVGSALITVPVETGLIGLGKFLAKGGMGLALREKNYFTHELAPGYETWLRYLRALVLREDIAAFRDGRERWGTHFGFDYRLVDDVLSTLRVAYKRYRVGSTMFYEIGPA